MSIQNTSNEGQPLRIFVTGATGYIGRVVTELALGEGYKRWVRLQCVESTSLDVLRQESAQADAVLHLAYIHDFTRDQEDILSIEMAAVDAIGEGLRGTWKPFVTSSGTMLVQPDPSGAETTEDAPYLQGDFVFKFRIRAERQVLRLSKEGIRVSALRLPTYVYGRGGSHFLPLLMQNAAKAAESVYIDDGSKHASGVHVDDAAALYLIAMREAKAGEYFNGNGSNITYRELAEAIGVVLELPVRSISGEEAEARWGRFLTSIVQLDHCPSNRKAIQQLGWQLKGVDILTDIRSGSYREVAEKLRQG